MTKKLVRLTEEDLHKIVKESINNVMAEGFFDIFRKKPSPEPEKKEEPVQDHVYSAKEMQWLYDNQKDLTPIQQKALKAGMWVRAMKANYHGYAKEWPNIVVKDGEVYYYRDGKLTKIPK